MYTCIYAYIYIIILPSAYIISACTFRLFLHKLNVFLTYEKTLTTNQNQNSSGLLPNCCSSVHIPSCQCVSIYAHVKYPNRNTRRIFMSIPG